MEMRSIHKCCIMFLCMVILTLLNSPLQAQQGVTQCSIKNGKMNIVVSKKLPPEAIASFEKKYGLQDLDLGGFIKTGSPDSLIKLGWKVEINNAEIIVISKHLFSADNINDPSDKIYIHKDSSQNISGERSNFGFNRFRNKPDFESVDSLVRFYLKGNTKANRVELAGDFNGWDPTKQSMTRTDSGWIADIKLSPGKHLYKFVIDGNWVIDKDNLTKENDRMGNDNSVYYRSNFIFKLDGYRDAKKVYVAGSFNGWKETDMMMKRTTTGWVLPVYLYEGTYTYRFIADRNWFIDPANPAKLPNEFNDFNSVIQIGRPHLFKLDGFLSARKVTLAGNFNNWRDDELFMVKTPTGWELPYALGPGNYEYRLTIDGKVYKPGDGKDNFFMAIEPNFTFRLKGYEHAKNVFLSGDLNNWNPQSLKMKRRGDEWIFEAHLNAGKHRYKFVVDGNWILDPGNKLWEQNEHNTGNSVLWIEKE